MKIQGWGGGARKHPPKGRHFFWAAIGPRLGRASEIELPYMFNIVKLRFLEFLFCNFHAYTTTEHVFEQNILVNF